MLGLESQYRLKDFFRAVAEKELAIENERQALAEIKDFEPYAAFCRVNRHGDKRVSSFELLEFLRDNGITQFSDRHTGAVVSYFDSDKDSGLNYKEFMEVCLPCDDLYMRSVVTQRPSQHCSKFDRLSYQVEKQLALLLQKEIEYHQQLEVLKADLKRRLDWSDMRAFASVDTAREGAINFGGLLNFCRLNGYYASESEVIAMVRRLDVDADQRINFDEFCLTFAHQEPLSLLQHGDPTSPVREDAMFRHTSPTRASPLRQRSPPRDRPSPQRNTLEESKGYGGFGSSLRESPRQSRHQPSSMIIQPSLSKVNVSRSTRDGSPLRQRSPNGRQVTFQDQSARLTSPMHAPSESHHARDFESPNKRAAVTQNLLGKSTQKISMQRQDDGKRTYAADRHDDYKPPSVGEPRRSALRFDEEEELIQAFKEIIRLEKEVEEEKIKLAAMPDFNLMDAFQIIDKHSKGWVTGPEMIEALSEFGTYPHKDDVYLFVRRFDKDSDGRLLYSDFSDAFTPRDMLSQQILGRRQAHHLQNGYPRSSYFTKETRESFLRAFRTHFTIEETSELLRKRLGRRPNFSVHDAFQTIDQRSNGYLTLDELQRILADHRVYPNHNDLRGLFDRFDKNLDGRISYSEFMDEMLPKAPSKQ